MTASTKNYKIRKIIINSIVIFVMNVQMFINFTKITLVIKSRESFFSIKANFISYLRFIHTFMRTIDICSVWILGFFKRKFFFTSNTISTYQRIYANKFMCASRRTANIIGSFQSVWMNQKFFLADWTTKLAFIYRWSSSFFHNTNHTKFSGVCL